MDANLVALCGGAAALLMLLAACLLLFGARTDHELQEKLRNLGKAVVPAAAAAAGRRPLPGGGAPLEIFRRLGELLRDRAFFSERDLQDVERTVVAAGF